LKFLKTFEELDFKVSNIKFNRIKDRLYRFTTDGLTYDVIFTPSFADNYKSAWSRLYDISSNTEIDFFQSNKNPLKIVSAVNIITESFLKEKDVEVMIIIHVLMENEKCPIDKLNKRAKINYEYLRKIPNYNLRYFNQPYFVNGDECITTNCIMYRDGVDISPIIDSWNKYRKHYEVRI